MNKDVHIGNNNMGDVNIGNVSVHEPPFLPCKSCGHRFLLIEDYEVNPYCNHCINYFRRKNLSKMNKIGAIVASIFIVFKLLTMNHLPTFFLAFSNDVMALFHINTSLSQNIVFFVLHIVSIFVPIFLVFAIIVRGFWLIAVVDNHYKLPLHS